MSIYLTRNSTSPTVKVEAFEQRGLGGQLSCKASESGVFVVPSQSPSSLFVYSNIHVELAQRMEGKSIYYQDAKKVNNCLSMVDIKIPVEIPKVYVEMKQGGEVLNRDGFFEAGTGKIGIYAGQPTYSQLKNILPYSLDLFYQESKKRSSVSAGFEFGEALEGPVAKKKAVTGSSKKAMDTTDVFDL
jgi:hypothetical protein